MQVAVGANGYVWINAAEVLNRIADMHTRAEPTATITFKLTAIPPHRQTKQVVCITAIIRNAEHMHDQQRLQALVLTTHIEKSTR